MGKIQSLMFKKISTSIFFLIFSIGATAQLVINEVSQGTGGSDPDEYVELLVVGTKTCTDSCVNLQNWILDDNNGFFGGTGIAAGHIKFSNSPQWACVPYGTIIVIYNAANTYGSIVADETDSNNDNVYFLPSNSSYFQGNSSVPVGGTPSTTYAGSLYSANGSIWSVLGMQNGNDVFQTVSPTNLTAGYFSVGWGNCTGMNISFAGINAGGLLFQNENLINNNPFTQGNWASQAENFGTPGLGNNAANIAWINAMRSPAINCNFTCSYDTILFDSYEYDSIMPGIVPGTIIHTIPRGLTSPFIGKHHTGTRFAYYNFQGTPGNVFSNRFIDVCPNTEFRYSFWIRQFDNNPGSNITINVYDGPNNTFPLINTQTIINSGTTYNQRVSSIMMATGSLVTIEFIDNLGGPIVGNDLCFDDFLIEMCMLDTLNLTKSYCNTSTSFNLYDEVANTVGASGSWNGPSALSNAHLGTFNPATNAAGIYTYTLAGAANCSDTVIAINMTAFLSGQGTLNLSSCNSVIYNSTSYYVSQSIFDTIIAGAANGCDSVLQVNIIVNQSPAMATIINDTICDGDSVLFNNQWRYTSGVYQDTLATSAGCDSIVTLNLTVENCSACNMDLGPDVLICGTVNMTLNAGVFDQYLWQNGSTNQTFNVTSTGQYWCTGQNYDTTNLVINSGFESGNTNFTTNYIVGTGGVWGQLSNAGTYAVSTSPSLVHNNFFSCSDHTTTGPGNMMIVNGSNTPNQAVWCQTMTVSPNTDYYFSIWAMSVENTNASNVASLFFQVNGVQIGTNFNPSYTACNWQQYTQTWNSGANTSANLCIFNHTIAGNNDFAIDDIFFGEICKVTDTINIISAPATTINDSVNICSGETVTIFGQTQSVAGIYSDTLVSTIGCDSIYHNTTLIVSDSLFFNKDTAICANQTIFLGGAIRNTNGVYVDTLSSSTSCDSLIFTTLTVSAAPMSGSVVTCTNIASQAYSGVDTFYNVLGCDSFYLQSTITYLAPTTVILVNTCTNIASNAVNSTDTLLTSLGCDSVYQRTIIRYINPSVTTLPEINICFGETETIFGVVQSQSGLYENNTVSVDGCDSIKISQSLVVNALPNVFAGQDTTIDAGNNALLIATGASTYTWNTGSTGSLLDVSPAQTTTYTVVGIDDNNCQESDSVTVFILFEDVELLMPTGFSPNGDGLNDVFRIVNEADFENITLRVYNRWGEMVFVNTANNAAWDGKYKNANQPIENYVYYIEATAKKNQQKFNRSGSISLVR